MACTACRMRLAPGTTVCPTCGVRLMPGTAPLDSKSDDETEPLGAWPMGEAILSTGETVKLDIGPAQLLLPISDGLILGRRAANGAPPDIDLGFYGAHNKGVSRKHVLIRRKNYLLFVLDLGSTNGTWLNGRRLLPNHERLLRSGDELQLGQLKLTVRF